MCEMYKIIQEKLKFYQEFKTELWLLIKKFEETEDLKAAYNKILGKIEVLEELIKTIEKRKNKE